MNLLDTISDKNNPNKLRKIKSSDEIKKAADKAAARWNNNGKNI